MIEIHDKYDIIPPNEYGRKWTKRYKQYTYSDVLGHDGIPGWELQNYGCGPTSMATILSSLGYDFDPIKVARRILLDEKGLHQQRKRPFRHRLLRFRLFTSRIKKN